MPSKFASCDTFVFITDENQIIFGKNADRPQAEVQEIVYFQAKNYAEPNSKLKCTYIQIDQAEKTNAIILSKPSWMWGAESGSNEYGVVIGNEAIWNTDANEEELKKPERLLGQDLLRLALERSRTAEDAIKVLTSLLAAYGQGGICAEKTGKGYDDLTYENSFLIADQSEAWILETIGKEWAAEQVVRSRNISNCLTITTKLDKESGGLRQLALDKNLWDGKEAFNFRKVFSSKSGDDRSRYDCGAKYLDQFKDGKKFDIFSMMNILRDEASGICRNIQNRFPTQGSQISVLSKARQVHWFTGTPDPSRSVFKPFIFTKDIKLTSYISKPIKSCEWKHLLYSKHEASYTQNKDKLNETLRNLERDCVEELESSLDLDDQALELNQLFNDAVDAELRFYK